MGQCGVGGGEHRCGSLNGMKRASLQGNGSNMGCQSPRRVRRSPYGGSTAQCKVRETAYDEEDNGKKGQGGV